MSTEIFHTTIKVPHQQLDARLLVPQSPVPGILFVHGWGGSQHFDLKRAHTIAGMGCICLTFDLAGGFLASDIQINARGTLRVRF